MKIVRVDCFTGTKGAGKTSLIIQSMQQNIDTSGNTALFLNEEGIVSYPAWSHLKVYPILGGCICCDGQTELIRQMQDSYSRDVPDRFIIELSGRGRTDGLDPLFQHVSGVEPGLFCHVINMQTFPSLMKIMGGLLWSQISAAPVIIVNRCFSLENTLVESCLEKIHEHNSKAVILPLNKKNQADKKVIHMKMYQSICPGYQEFFLSDDYLDYKTISSFSSKRIRNLKKNPSKSFLKIKNRTIGA